MRTRNAKNSEQHRAFLDQIGDGSVAHAEAVSWFATLPLWLDLGGLRVVHACWHVPARLLDEVAAPSLASGGAWLNSPPLAMEDLRGEVVLINFWNFTRINWLRQLPDVRAWAERYRDWGLVVIGVHAPEFSFEKSIEEVRRAVK